MKPTNHSPNFSLISWLVISIFVLAVPASWAQSNNLDWTTYELGAVEEFDYVGTIPAEADTIQKTLSNVDGTGIDMTLRFDPVRGTVDTRSTDGTLPDRDSLQEMLLIDDAHTGIFELFTYPSGPGATLNYGFGESDRDDAILSTFSFSAPVQDVTFDAIDVDKSNWTGPFGFETSGQGDGWIDQLTITGYLNGNPVYPTFGPIPSGSNTPALNPYFLNGDPNPNDFIAVNGVNNNILEGRWEFSEKGAFGTQPDDGGTWATDGTYGSDNSIVAVIFPTPIDTFTIKYANLWSVPGNDNRTTPTEYWGGHSQETGISDIGFSPYECEIALTDGASGTPYFQPGGAIFIEATDHSYNSNSGVIDSFAVTLTNVTTGETESVTVTETSANSGIFTNAGFPSTDTGNTANNDGTLNVQFGQEISVSSPTGGTGAICSDAFIYPIPGNPTITKAVDEARASEGDTLTYTVGVGYPGSDPLIDVVVSDELPTDTTYVAASATAGGGESGGTVSWNLGSALPGTPVSNQPSGGATVISTEAVFIEDGKANQDGNAEMKSKVGAKRGLVKFGVSIPPGTTVQSAVLGLYATNAKATNVTVHEVTSTWTETGVTWAAAPTYNTTAAATLPLAVQDTFTEVDITSLVQGWATTPANNFGILLDEPNGQEQKFASDDGADPAPRLIITYSGVATELSAAATSLSTSGDTLTLSVTAEADMNLSGIDFTLTPTGLTNMGLTGPVTGPALTGNSLVANTPTVFTWTYTVTNTVGATPETAIFDVSFTAPNSVSSGSAFSNGAILTPPLQFGVTIDTGAGVNTPITNTASVADSSGYIQSTQSAQANTVVGNIIGNYVWIDTDGDGEQDGTETGLNGVTVNLLDSSGDPTGFTTTTANDGTNDGAYLFEGVPDGSYIVEFVKPAGYDLSPQDTVGDTVDSDADLATGRTDLFAVGPEETDLAFDAGMYQPVTISGLTEYNNNDGNGNQPLGSVTMRLLDSAGNPVDDPNVAGVQDYVVTTSGVDGSYSFSGLPPGSYRVAQDQPPGYQSTSDTDGLNNNVIGDETPIVLTSGQSSANNNFLEEQLGAITGFALDDTDNDGAGETGIGSVSMRLLDSAGTPVDDPNQPGTQDYVVTTAATTGAYSFINLPPGDYQVEETQPAGYDSVSDADGGDLDLIGDQTLISVTAGATNAENNFVEELPASLGDIVFLDIDGDGIQDGGAEVGIDGVLVRLLDDATGNEIATTYTSGGGLYLFDDLTPGNYRVDFVPPTGYDITLQDQVGSEATDSDASTTTGETAQIVIARGDELTNVDAGLVPNGSGAIGNYVWLDEDGDGVQDAGETGIPGLLVELLDSGGSPIASTVTDANGGYLFPDLAAGDYTIRINGGAPPTGMTLTGDPDATANNLHPVTLSAGEEYLAADFGYNWVSATATTNPGVNELGAIGDRIWSDANSDGIQDPGESGIAGVTVNLYSDSNGDGVFDTLAGTATTDASGNYIITGLEPDAYVAIVSAGSGTPLDGATQTGDPDGVLDNASTNAIILGPGDVYVNADFGYNVPSTATIGDTIYLDADADGSYSAAVDTGIPGVTVALIDTATGGVMATTTTDANGNYSFPGLATGTDGDYTVRITDTDHVLGDLAEAQDPDGGTPRESNVTDLAADDLDQDFGFVPAGHTAADGLIGDTVFLDFDGDGNFDAGEGIEGVTVNLYDAAGTVLIATTKTDENGNYFFGGLDKTATYVVKVDTSGALSGLTNTVDPDTGGDSESLVDLNADADGVVPTQDFGYEGANTISGIVWEDPDADGTRAAGETFRFEFVTVTLFDGAGNVVGTTTTDPTGAYSFDNLPDGDYSIKVTDTANVLDGHWHSIGSDSAPDPTTVSVGGVNPPTSTLDFGYYLEPAVIGDFVWHDLNGDGVQDSGEPGIGGVDVTLTVTYSNGDVVTLTVATAPDGSYSFEGLLDENYAASGGAGEPSFVVTVATPPGFAPTLSDVGGAPADALDSDNGIAGETAEGVQGASDPTNDFGFVQTASIGNYVWHDENGDGVQDAGEDGIPGVLVELHDEFGATIATTLTDASGGYLFTDVATGVARTVIVKSSSLPIGMTNQTGDPDVTPDDEHTVTLSPGDEYMVADFGYNYAPASDTDTPIAASTGSIGDRIWNDADSDGIQDAGEAGIAAVEVKIYTDPDGDGVYNNLVGTTTTDVHGNYIFDDLSPDSYRVEVTPPSGYTQTGDVDGTLDHASTSPIILGPGDVFVNADFGYVLDSGAADIGDTIYLDANANGTFDGSDVGIAGVTVALTDGGGNVIATTTTDASGNYLFPGLPSSVSYQVIVTDTDHVLGNLAQTGDPDATLDGKSTVVSLAPTGDLDQDFGYAPAGHDVGEGLIGDTVFLDTDNSGTLTAGEGIEGVTVSLYDATGTTIIASTVTDESGNYWFGGLDPLGSYTVKVDTTGTLSGLANMIDPDTINPGDSESFVDLSASSGINLDQDFGYVGPNDISGIVWLDPDADGTRAGTELTRFGGVTVDLLDSIGNIIATTPTLPDGSYSFDNVPDGAYTVDITDDANVLAGYWHSLGTDSAPDSTTVTVDSGNTSATIDFGYYKDLASVGNYVFNDANFDGVQDGGDTPISGAVVTLTVTYPNGAVITATTTTAGDGSYSFENLLADEDYIASGGAGEPTFELTAATPAGLTPTFSNTGADDTVDSDDGVAGELAEIVQGGSDLTNDFGYTGIKPDSWTNWQTANAADLGTETGPSGNDDGDLADNLLEYAFCLDPDTGSPHRAPNPSERGGYCLEESGTGTLDAFFTRPLGGLADVTYTLEITAALGDPTSWTDVSSMTPTITDNGDGTETVRYVDLENIDGTTAEGIDLSAGIGFARLRVDLSIPAATSHTEVFGWSTHSAQAECETCSNPFAPKDVFSGTVTSGTDVLNLANSTGSTSISAAMADRPHYIEIVNGTYAGHRLDVASATGTTITLSTTSVRNTLDPIPDLSAQQIVLRAHTVLDDIVTAQDFVDTVTPLNNNDQSTAGRVLFYDNVNGWSTYYAYNNAGAIDPAYWTATDNTSLENVGDVFLIPESDDELVIIDPCAGFFVHSKAQSVDTLMVGIVREWDFVCSLKTGYNFVGSGYPLDQSPNDRSMSDTYFTATTDPSTADQFEFWMGDGPTFGVESYDSHFRVDFGTPNHWVTQENSSLASEDEIELFLRQRSSFINSRTGNPKTDLGAWTWPVPWAP